MVTFMPHTIVTMTTFYITDSTQAVVKTYRSMVASAPTAASSNPSNDINDIHDVSHHHHHQEAQQEERQQQQHEPPSPFDHLKWHELLTFSFVKPIVKLGLRKTLDQDDLHPVAQQDRASVVTEELEREWQSELERAAAAAASGRGGQRLQKPSLWRAFYRAHRYEFIISGMLLFGEAAIMIAKPIMLRFLLMWLQGSVTFSSKQANLAYGYGLAVGLAALDFVQTFLHHKVFYITLREGWRLRTSVVGLMHKKILRLSSQWQSSASTGAIVSMISNDAQRYEEFPTSLHFMWISPLQAICGFVLLILFVGWEAALVGCCFTVGVMPLQVWCGRQVGKARRRTAGLTDKRVKLMNEVLAGIQSVKAFTWEVPFQQAISHVRSLERQSLAWAMVNRALTMGIFFFSPSLAAFVTFVVYWARGHTLELPTVFAVMSLLQVLREAARWIPRSIEQVSEAHVATTRIQPMLLLPEVTTAAVPSWTDDDDEDLAKKKKRIHYYQQQQHGVEKKKKVDSSGFHRKVAEGSEGREEEEKQKPRKETVLEIHDCDFSWDHASSAPSPSAPVTQHGSTKESLLLPPTTAAADIIIPTKAHLGHVTLRVQPGELLVVAGVVGSGKSTLLDAILGEIACVRGSGVYIQQGTRVAYCAQQPWIQTGTLRDNILFGDQQQQQEEEEREKKGRRRGGRRSSDHLSHNSDDTHFLDRIRYDKAVASCALTHDFAQLPAGDMTEIGELGVNLSGGQRARVALARAVYGNADLYLLDDVLSAVDARVSKHLFHQCIRGELRQKAVILVTHQIQYLSYATRVCLLNKEGEMVACEPWDVLKEKVPDWKALVESGKGHDGSIDGGTVAENGEEEDDGEEQVEEANSPPASSLPSLQRKEKSNNKVASGNATTFVMLEERVQGKVHGETYISYLKSGGLVWGLTILILLLISQGVMMLSDFWLKIWASSSPEAQRKIYYLRWYAIIMALVVFLGLFRAQFFFRFSLRASTNMHDKALKAVLAAPFSFFNSNPRGRILNKFSKDLDSADDLLPYCLFDFLQSGMLCLSAVIVGCIAVPYLLLIVAPLAYFFVQYRREFISTAREVKRLDGITRSPIYADVSASLVGGKTIRAFNAQTAMEKRFLQLLDENGKCCYYFLILNRYLGYRLDMLCAYFLTLLCLSAVLLRSSLDTGLIALSLTYALSLSGMFQWAIRQSAQTETLLTSVERLHYYTRLPNEGLRYNPAYPAPKAWPCTGAIQVKNLRVRYRDDLPIVLDALNFSIPAGTKVGVIGRTGSGKSSFLAALLRLNEVVAGDIEVDGVSLTQLGLVEARSSMAWIPQDPNLFAGTLRFNLDPFSRYTDAEIWGALEAVQLKSITTSLDMPISEGGGNLSVGQRQLLSLARAVLLRRKILLMDEATANVDYMTDQLIQDTIKRAPAFRGCTIVVVAHRIKTVLDSDVIVVFQDGHCVEQGSPQELLSSPSSTFATMVKEAGGGNNTVEDNRPRKKEEPKSKTLPFLTRWMR